MAAPLLLTDEQVQRFIAHGYLCLPTQLPESFHGEVYERFDRMIGTVDEGNNPGNNLLPLVPELDAIFADPVVTGALTSVVGPGYAMHPHRALHNNLPGSPAQHLHKDSYWGFRSRVRNHRPRWVMVMYVPQATPLEQGPTGVVPGSQYQTRRPDPEDMPEVPGSLPAGGFLLIHYDVWHRKMKNVTNRNRFMMKFEFARMADPSAASWDHRDPEWRLDDPPRLDMSAVWQRQWNWMRHAPGRMPSRPAVDVKWLQDPDPRRRLAAINAMVANGQARAALPSLAALLEDPCDAVTIDAAYAVAEAGTAAIQALVEAIRRNDGAHVQELNSPQIPADYVVNAERVARAAFAGLTEIGLPAVPELVRLLREARPRGRKLAASALGEIAGTDRAATEALVAATQDEEPTVRVNAVEALGWKAPLPAAISALSEAIRDREPDVRFSAALSLAQLGPSAEAAIPALAEALHDENRYVPGYAVEALERIAAPSAMRTLLPFLKNARWCPQTTTASIY